MKGKYIDLQTRLACIRKPSGNYRIYLEIEKTIQEHKRVMRQYRRVYSRNARIDKEVTV